MIIFTISQLMYLNGLMFAICACAFLWLSFKLWLMSLGLV